MASLRRFLTAHWQQADRRTYTQRFEKEKREYEAERRCNVTLHKLVIMPCLLVQLWGTAVFPLLAVLKLDKVHGLEIHSWHRSRVCCGFTGSSLVSQRINASWSSVFAPLATSLIVTGLHAYLTFVLENVSWRNFKNFASWRFTTFFTVGLRSPTLPQNGCSNVPLISSLCRMLKFGDHSSAPMSRTR